MILIVSGSRADYGLLEWPIKLLTEAFDTNLLRIWGQSFEDSFANVRAFLAEHRPRLMLILGDRYEILAAATAAHLARVPIAHIGGGDVTEGSYDDAMRDSISRMASLHFVTSTSAMARLSHMGYRNVHLVGNPSVDYIRHAKWRGERPIEDAYCVVSLQAETSEATALWQSWFIDLPDMRRVFIRPNPDRGSDGINLMIATYARSVDFVHNYLPHAEFLNLLAHCEEFIGNSSAMLYEAPELGIKTRMIGKRQRGRTIPWGDGHASERIVNILRYVSL